MCMFEKPAYIEYTIIALWSFVIVEKFFLGLLLCSFYGTNGNKRVCKYLIINLLRCLFKKKLKLYIWSVSLVWLQSASREMTV